MVDAENWMTHPGSAYALLNLFRHPKTPRNFVILSGDVHYSFVFQVKLRHKQQSPSIWQVTSSGLKNELPHKLLALLDTANRWLYASRSPLNWFTKRRRMKITHHKPIGETKGRRLVNYSGYRVSGANGGRSTVQNSAIVLGWQDRAVLNWKRRVMTWT